MGDRYRFPPELGGGEHEAAWAAPGLDDPAVGDIPFNLPGFSRRLWLPLEVLTKIQPDAPPPGSIVQIGTRFFQRRDDAGIDWQDLASGIWQTWAQACEGGSPIRFVPDPFADSVELPWQEEDPDGATARVAVRSTEMYRHAPRVRVEAADGCDFSPDEARSMARALWAAADVAERES
jgi:hypothetical protein